MNEEKCLELMGRIIKLKPGDEKKFIDCLIDDNKKTDEKERIVKLDFL